MGTMVGEAFLVQWPLSSVAPRSDIRILLGVGNPWPAPNPAAGLTLSEPARSLPLAARPPFEPLHPSFGS